jgi:hypothetical protein
MNDLQIVLAVLSAAVLLMGFIVFMGERGKKKR